MKNQRNGRNWAFLGILGASAGLTFVACTKVDTVPPGDGDPTTTVTSCGALDAASAAQLLSTRLDRFGTVGLAALAGLENSRAAARVLSFGNESIIEPFVAEAQSDLHESIAQLRDELLVAANLESSTDSSVTYIMRPESICDDETLPVPTRVDAVGGAPGTGTATAGAPVTTIALDSECVKRATEHPTRIRVSRIACDQGDNVAVEVLYDTSSKRMLTAELYAERAEIDLYLGTYLSIMTVTSSTSTGNSSGVISEETTTKPLVSAATGVVHGTLTLTGDNRASGKISVTEAIDVTVADESAARVRLAAGTDLATIAADGASKTITVAANVGAFDWRVRFSDFIDGLFGLSTNPTASEAEAVDMHAAGLKGKVSFNGTTDTLVAEGLSLGTEAATATQGARTLLSVAPVSVSGGAIDATVTGTADDRVGLLLPTGLKLDIRYGLEPVMALLQNPANYLAKDTLTVSATAGSRMELFPETDGNDLAVVASQTGALLRVESGALSLKSNIWPNDSVTASDGQCMTRTPAAAAGHDLLDDFTVASCSE